MVKGGKKKIGDLGMPKRGITKSPLTQTHPASNTGTDITFKPDSKIFQVSEYKWDILANRLRELAFLNKGIRILLNSSTVYTSREAGMDKQLEVPICKLLH